jgi:hypothetical protein
MNKSYYEKILKKYCKYIVHMRQQYRSQHLGLIFGAGASIGLGFPNWIQLVKEIMVNDEIKDLSFSYDEGKDAISNAQRLFQTYKAKQLANCSDENKEYNRIEMIVRSGWQKIVHSALYKNIASDINKSVPENHFLRTYIEIIKKLPMIVNYNFDDTIQRMLASIRTSEEKEMTRGYSTIWNADVYMYPKRSVIYHPNGFLPYSIHEHPSEQLVFLEESFADQLIESLHGRYNVLSNYFTHNTCLLIGLSLNDPTLKNTLRNHSLNFPGNYHYYVHHLENDEQIENEYAIIDTNFEVYNLVTLFLTEEDVNILGKLITMGDDEFQEMAEEFGLYNSYKYIIVGSVSVGKSTAMSHFRSISTQDEWLDSMPEEMAKDPNKVDEDRIKIIDEWIAEQWGKKNYKLLNIKDGIHLIDRGPLDAFAFTSKGEWKNKAVLTKNAISPGKAKRELCSACILLLTGDPETMASRALATHRDTDADKLKQQQDLLKYIYTENGGCTKVLDTKNKGKSQVAKEIARMIYLEDYEEAPLNEWLENIVTGTIAEPDHLF